MSKEYKIGDVLEFDGFPKSRVVGIDRYKLHSLSGIEKKWPSYTLVSDESGLFSRWWLTQEKGKEYFWLRAEKSEIQGEVDIEESGLCILQAEGDSITDSPYSSVTVFKHDNGFYCLEAFEGTNEVLCMKGKQINQ